MILKILDLWIGADETELVRMWGPPKQVYSSEDRKFLVYSTERNIFIPGTDPSYTTTFIGDTAYTSPIGGTSSMNIPLSCITTFELLNNRIISYQWRGNDCKAR